MQSGPPTQLLDIQACFQVAHGTHKRREAMLWQQIRSNEALIGLLGNDLPPEHRGPGCYMYDALALPRSVGEPVAADERLVAPVLRLCTETAALRLLH